MSKIQIVNFSIPDRFIPVYDKFLVMIAKDEQFKEVLTNMPARYNHKNKTNVLRSAKIRFIMARYVDEIENAELEARQKVLEAEK